MNFKKIIAILLTTAAVSSVLAIPASAEWEKADGKTYWTEDGKKATGFEKIDGSYYYFKQADGSMATGWMKISGKYYYFSKSSGKMLAGNTYKIDGKTYKFGADGVWDGKTGGTAASSSGTTAKATTGYRNGVWGEKLSATKKRVGSDWVSVMEGEEISLGMDMGVAWTKYGDTKSIGSVDMYIYTEDALFAGATMYIGTSPLKNGKPTEEMPTTNLTKAQINALAKSLATKAVKNAGKEVDPELIESSTDTSSFDGFRMFAGETAIACIVYNYDDNMIMYIEISTEAMAELSGYSVDDIIAELF
jgi:hypothetical protein